MRAYLEEANGMDQLELLAQIRASATANIEDAHKNYVRYNKTRLDAKFKPNDLVLYDWAQVTDKGPYRLVRPIGTVCYVIENINNPTSTKIVHVQTLQKYVKKDDTENEHHDYDISSNDDRDKSSNVSEEDLDAVTSNSDDSAEESEVLVPQNNNASNQRPHRRRQLPKHLKKL